MRARPAWHGGAPRAFTLIELLVVIAIMALLGILAMPEFGRLVERAKSATCMGNLRSIGGALGSYLSDHDGRFPHINNPPPFNVYDEAADDGEAADEDAPILTLSEAFGPYGIPERGFRCPADAAMNNYFAGHGTSYEWVPLVDGEQSVAPKILSRRGQMVVRKNKWIIVLRDFDAVHFGRSNRLYADGHVVMAQK